MIDYTKQALSKLIEGIIWFDEPLRLREILRRINSSLLPIPPEDNNQYAIQNGEWTEVESSGYTPPYLVYTAIVNQSGTSAPELTVLENTLGVTITPTYSGVGNYTFTPSSNILDLTKTTIDISPIKFISEPSTSKASYTIIHATDALFRIHTHQAGSSTWSQTDNNFRNNKLEIRVYN